MSRADTQSAMTDPTGGITDLATLLRSLRPTLHEGVYVFCTWPTDVPIPADLRPACQFSEREALTLIVREEDAARHGLAGVFPSAWITLEVHSALSAVGLMAAISRALADARIPCNAVSAYYHDHIFVPESEAERAIGILRALAAHA